VYNELRLLPENLQLRAVREEASQHPTQAEQDVNNYAVACESEEGKLARGSQRSRA
jgi:hypothetical protein